jgi:excisionase family DNA binding protein
MTTEWIDVKKAAEYMGVHQEVVRRWVRAGRLRGQGVGKTGKVYRFKVEALDRYLETNAKTK